MVRTFFCFFSIFSLGDGNKCLKIGFFQKKFTKLSVKLKMDIFKMSNFKKFFNSWDFFFHFFIKIIINIINIIITYTNIMIRQKERNLNLWCQNTRAVGGIIVRIIWCLLIYLL